MKKESEKKFMSLAPMIKTANGEIAYLRIGKGLAYGKVWCDYVIHKEERVHLHDKFFPTFDYVTPQEERVYLHDEFFPTIEEAVNALYEKAV